MGLTISSPPGFADVSDSVLAANQPALGFDIAKIYENSAFSLVRTEIFVEVYKNGETVALPISPIDNYAYSRDELIYIWAMHNSVDPSTGWISGKDSLFYAAWLVDQSTGAVTSDEWYRTSGHSGVPNGQVNETHTNDGDLWVFTIAQRGLTELIMASSPTYSAITASWIAQDKPLSQQLAQGLNDDAKFAVVDHEVFYLGEYTHGQTVTLPTSPVDGYAYSAAECKFIFSMRWTYGSANFNQPPANYGQLGPIQASVNSSGLVSISETYIDNSGNDFSVNVGRIAVFAFTQRSGTPATITPTANQFAEIPFEDFIPGSPLPYTIAQQILNNLLEGMLTPEFFGPTTHANGDTIPLPTSPIDGYTYARNELYYIWTFTDTTPASGSNVRVASFGGTVHPDTGVVSLYGYRLPPGGPYVAEDASKPRISVITVARRNAQAVATPTTGDTTNPQSDSGTVQTDLHSMVGMKFVVATGAINGSNQAFTIPDTATIVAVFLNGLPRTDFAQTPPSTSFTTTFTAQTGDTLYVLYYIS